MLVLDCRPSTCSIVPIAFFNRVEIFSTRYRYIYCLIPFAIPTKVWSSGVHTAENNRSSIFKSCRKISFIDTIVVSINKLSPGITGIIPSVKCEPSAACLPVFVGFQVDSRSIYVVVFRIGFRIGNITAYRTSVSSLAVFGSHPIVIECVTLSLYFLVSCIIASGASYVCIPADFCTSSVLCLVSDLIVTKLCAFNSYRICFIAIIALSGLGAVLCASSVIVRNVICEAVSSFFNCFLSNKNFLTNVTVLTFGKTCFCTSRSNSLVNNLGMTGFINVCINVGVAAFTCMSGVTLLGTSRISYNFGIAVYVFKCGDGAGFSSIASITFTVLSSFSILCSGSIYDPLAPLMTKSRNCLLSNLIIAS